ncbi:MAG: hypothetical protein JXR34_11710, partial [Bacteroidales bacterium]|nr:hypothetical protein [Bacteroidales bacterium]
TFLVLVVHGLKKNNLGALKLNKAYLILIIGSFFLNLFGINQTFPHYDINLKIDPNSHEIWVKGELMIESGFLKNDILDFYLYRDLKINEFTLNGINTTIIDTSKSDLSFIPLAHKLSFNLEDDLHKSKVLKIKFEYQGELGKLPKFETNKIDTIWTELGLYYPWFPFNPKDILFYTYNVSVESVPGYKIFGIGKIEEQENQTIITGNVPTNDIVICLSKNIKTYTTNLGKNKLRFFHQNLNDTLIIDVMNHISEIVYNYKEWFGNKDMDISFIKAQRESGGGYARIGGIVVGGFNSDDYYSNIEEYARYFAHELAHLWWFKAEATSWEDWLNESFAEYSSISILRALFGQDTYSKAIMNKKETLKDSPAIWNFDRNKASYQDARTVLYDKGPVLLSELEQEIGSKEYIYFCKKLVERNVSSTTELLETLRLCEGDSVSVSFENKLKTR